MNQSAFTLFTALVSFVLIVLAVLLIGQMTFTSSANLDMISAIEEQTELQAIADLARADAIQAFNYNVRFKLESYLTSEDNAFQISFKNSDGTNKSWKAIQKEFARANFAGRGEPGTGERGKEAFANIMSKNIVNILDDPPPIRGFKADLQNNDETVFRGVIHKSALAATDDGTFFEVVDCDGTIDSCNIGTFYVNLKFGAKDLSDREYETLPQIRVENRATGRAIRTPILPRSSFKIYVPLRMFKAISNARYFAVGKAVGILDSGYANNIQGMALGVCDSACSPRTHVVTGSYDEKQKTLFCPGDSGESFGEERSLKANNSVMLADGSAQSYNPSDATSVETTFERIVKAAICQKALQISNIPQWSSDATFIPIGSSCSGKVRRVIIQSRNVNRVEVIKEPTTTGQAQQKYNLPCSVPSTMEVTVGFQEKNPLYIVNQKTYAINSNASYKIKIKQGYSPSTTKVTCKSVCETSMGSITGCSTRTCRLA